MLRSIVRRLRFRLTLRGLLGGTTFLAAVLAAVRLADFDFDERLIVVTTAFGAAAGTALANHRWWRMTLSALAWAAAAALATSAFALRDTPSSTRGIATLAVLGALAGGLVGCGAWLCLKPTRALVSLTTFAAIVGGTFLWSALAYWRPERSTQLARVPEVDVISTDFAVLFSGWPDLECWDTATGRQLPAMLQLAPAPHATIYF